MFYHGIRFWKNFGIRSSPHHSDQHRYKKQRLDIICCFSDPLTFKENIRFSFGREKNFKEFTPSHPGAIATSFELDNFVIGVFGQLVPTREEAAYRHMLIEYKLLEEKGEAFRQQIIALKKQGYKTEPAFAMLLGIGGNAYEYLLTLHTLNT